MNAQTIWHDDTGRGAARCARVRADAGSAPHGRGIRFRGEDFVLARYLESGSASAYGGTRIGSATVMAGMIVNTRTNARTTIVGAGSRIRIARGADVGFIATAAIVPGGGQARLYALPRFVKRPLSFGATAMYAEPIDGDHHDSCRSIRSRRWCEWCRGFSWGCRARANGRRESRRGSEGGRWRRCGRRSGSCPGKDSVERERGDWRRGCHSLRRGKRWRGYENAWPVTVLS